MGQHGWMTSRGCFFEAASTSHLSRQCFLRPVRSWGQDAENEGEAEVELLSEIIFGKKSWSPLLRSPSTRNKMHKRVKERNPGARGAPTTRDYLGTHPRNVQLLGHPLTRGLSNYFFFSCVVGGEYVMPNHHFLIKGVVIVGAPRAPGFLSFTPLCILFLVDGERKRGDQDFFFKNDF